MGLLKQLFGGGGGGGGDEPEGGREVAYPGTGAGDQFRSGREAIEALIARMLNWELHRESAWATFTMPGAREGRRDIVIEVAGDNLNMLKEDLPADIVEAAGLERIDSALYRLRDADAKMMADVIDTILRTHFGVAGNYEVRGKIQN